MSQPRFSSDPSSSPHGVHKAPPALVRLGRDTSGAAVVEYAMLVGVMISVTCVGMAMLGYSIRMAIAPLPGQLQSGDVAVATGEGKSTPDAAKVAPQTTPQKELPGAASAKTAPPSSTPKSWRMTIDFTFLVPLVSSVLLTASWMALRRQRKRREAALAEMAAEDEEDPDSLRLRIQAKRQSLWRNLLNDSDLLLKNRIEVRDLMTRDPIVITPNASFEEVTMVMHKKRIRHLLVCDSQMKLLGVISDKDLPDSTGNKARDLMNRSPDAVAPDTPISTAITRLAENAISCLPVVDEENRIQGILTSVDLIITLQCALQFCGRLAQATQANPEWARDVEAASNSMEHGMDDQRRCLSRLKDRLADRNGALDDSWWKEFSEDAEGFLDTTSKLTSLVSGAHNRISEHTEQLMGAIAPRTDLLTGLSNRHELDSVLKMMMALSARQDHSLTFALIAIDNFQKANAQFGEQWATKTLCSLAKLIVEAVRESDFVTRFDEASFAVVMAGTDLPGAQLCCERIRLAVRASSGASDCITVRTGLVALRPDEGSADLFDRAKSELYDAQLEGGDCVHVHSDEESPVGV